MATPAEKQKLREKGHLAYNPTQSFMLSVRWVLRNRRVAEEMLSKGLKHCAFATHRDTPCVPLYFFRLSYDQSEAKAFDETVKTMGDHPHYSKVFKSIEMGIPLAVNENKLRVSGIDPKPLSWGISTVLDAEKKSILEFSPVTISLSEIYLDDRAFLEHADSPDYLKAYGVVMEPHRSLKATSKCLGTPTSYMLDTILTPYLQVELVEGGGLLGFSPSAVESTDGVHCFLEFCFELEQGWQDKVGTLFKSLNAVTQAGMVVDGQIRVEISFFNPEQQNWKERLDGFRILAGQMFVFSKEEVNRLENLPETVKFYCVNPDGTLFGAKDDVFFAGYVVHPKFKELIQDETVKYQRS